MSILHLDTTVSSWLLDACWPRARGFSAKLQTVDSREQKYFFLAFEDLPEVKSVKVLTWGF